MIKTSVNKINVSNIYELPILYQWLFLDLIQVWVLAVKCPDIFVSWEIYLIETVGISLFTKWLYTLIGVSLEQSYTTQKTNTFENHLCSHQPGTPGLWGHFFQRFLSKVVFYPILSSTSYGFWHERQCCNIVIRMRELSNYPYVFFIFCWNFFFLSKTLPQMWHSIVVLSCTALRKIYQKNDKQMPYLVQTSFAKSATLGDTSWDILTTELHTASWNLTEFQLSWSIKMEHRTRCQYL